MENRRRAAGELTSELTSELPGDLIAGPARLVTLHQTHSAQVAVLDRCPNMQGQQLGKLCARTHRLSRNACFQRPVPAPANTHRLTGTLPAQHFTENCTAFLAVADNRFYLATAKGARHAQQENTLQYAGLAAAVISVVNIGPG